MAEAFATPVASNLVSKLGEYLFAPIGRQFGYVLCYKCYVEDLESGVKKLENARKRVQSSVDEAVYNGKLIHADVEDWLESVNREAKEAEKLLNHGESAQNTCFCGWLPNPVARHPVGRKVKKITKVILELFMESQSPKFQKVYHENPPIGIVAANTFTARSVNNREDVLESRAKITEDVLKAIVDDEVCVIGVWGAGGVGKSKLLEDVERRVKEENLFDVVATAIISHTPNLKEIQGAIAYALGLKLANDELADERAQRLRKRIEDDSKKNMREDDSKKNMIEDDSKKNMIDDDSKKNMIEDDSKKNILIILDDLWEKLELKKVGIPCSDDNKVRGCKLLLTSRKLDVLRIDMGSDREFQLNVLEYGEARKLFERTIGDRINSSEFEPWVDGVVKNCGGMPLSIVPLATMLKHKDLAEWKNASTNRDLLNVKSVVELSYNDIKEERIRSLFLVCALTSGRISVRDSLIYCIGLGLYKMFSETIQSARYKLIVDLCSLRDSSLLLDNDAKELFRMHDIFVEAAISIASMEWNALVGRKGYGFKAMSKDELRKCTLISFPYVGIDELPAKLDCPNLKMLLIFEHNRSLEIPESFFESMEKLQVLDLTGLDITTLPPSTEFLENLRSLSLDHCHLGDVTILGKLKGLQFLSFTGSTITRLPKEIGELTELRFLDLNGCFRLQIIERGMLKSLVKLEELYINKFCQWEAEDEAPRSNASLAELKNMKKLSALDITIPHSTKLSSDLPFGNLNEHKIRIGSTGQWRGEYKQSRTLKLQLDSSNLLHEVWMQECLGRTQDLRLNGLQDGRYSIHDLCTKGFQELKHLHVKNNLSFHCIADSAKCPAFTRLESLVLENLKNLEKICHDYLAPKSFVRLKTVKVKYCNEIKYLFPSSTMKRLLQLEEIEITGCNLMQHIVANAKVDDYIDEVDNDANVKSCKLRRLTLQDLPKMTSFCKTEDHSVIFPDGQQVSLPWLETLTLSKLPKLKEIWNSQFLSDVSSIKFLEVEDCTFLLSIIPSNFLIKLQNLEAITILRCRLIREVFDLEGLIASGDVEILSRLTRLTLSELPSLERIWNKNPRRALCFGNLTTLKVQKCEKLRFFFSSSTAKALGKIKEIEIMSCKLMEEVVDVQEEESQEIATTNTLEFPLLASLSLVELPNLRTFSYGKYYIHYPSLTKLTISGCPKMMTFSSFEGKQQSIQQVFGHVNSGLSLPVFFNEKALFPSLEELKLSSMCELKRIWHNQFHGQSFCKLASLTLELCENLSYVFPLNSLDRLQSLKKIEVVGCPSLEALFELVCLNSEKRQKPLVLSSLEKMKLSNLPRLRDIFKSDYKVTLAFPSLMEVNVGHCHNLPYLFSTAMATTLAKLVVLDVSYCNNLRGIIVIKEGKGKTVETFEFHHLTKLKLGDLKSLICFSLENCTGDRLYPLFDEKLAFPKLEELHIEGVQQEELWNNKILMESLYCLKVLKVKRCHNLVNVIPSFMSKRLLHYMESLTVEECPRLRNLFTMSMAKSLGQLQYLGLGGCGEMEYIVTKEEEKPKEATDKIVIPQLVTLHLHNMPKLRSFCQGKHILEWPSLKEFLIKDCKAVKVLLGDASCRKLEGSSPTHQALLLLKKIEFPNMELMKISHMDNVEKIWLDDLPSNAFSKLKTLVVEHCEKLSSIFSSYAIFTRFQNLEKITVTDCGSLEVVFHVQEFNFSEGCSASTFQLKELVLTQLPKMKHVWSGLPQVGLIFERFECMTVDKCESLKILFPSSVAKSMTQLKELSVWNCGVEKIVAEESTVGTGECGLFFPRLTRLRLRELPELKSFYRHNHTSTWPLLKELKVRHCGKMRSFSFACECQCCQGTTPSKNQPALEMVIPHLEGLTLVSEDVVILPQHYVFCNLRQLTLACYHDENVAFPSNFLLDRFPNLKALLVACSSFKEIFPEDLSGHGGATPYGELSDMEKTPKALQNLRRLHLYKLCNLKRVWKDGSLMVEILKQIEVLWVGECPSLLLVLPSLTSFRRLTHLGVRDCAGLVHMGTFSAVTSLVHLTWLTLRNCGAMEDVVTNDGNGVVEISFPTLRQLMLDDLPSLESFSPTNCTFRFPSLVHIVVLKCPKMNIFCKGALQTPNLNKVLLSEEDDEWRWEGDLNTTIRTLSA